MAYRSTVPKLQDTDNVLLFKIAQSLSAGPLAGDSANNLLRKIAEVLAAASGGSGGDFTVANLFATNGTFTTVTATDGNFVNLTAVNGSITNLTTALQQVNGPVVIQPTTNVTQLKLIDSPGQSVQAFQIFQSDGVTQVFGVNFSGSTQIFRQAADTSGASLTHLKRGNTGDATAAIASGAQLSQDNYQGWDGAAFVNGAQVMAVAREAFTLTARGSQFEFRTAAVGATALTLVATISTSAFILGTAVSPASLVGGFLISDGTAPSANPVASTAIYSSSGQFLYRTSAASEGAGQGNRVHNRALTVVGTGADYALTTTSARVDFGGTDAEVTLPTSGTYMLHMTVGISGGGSAVGDLVSIKLRNATDSTDFSEDTVNSISVAGARITVSTHVVVVVNALKLVQIFARNQSSANGSIVSTLTKISFIRLS